MMKTQAAERRKAREAEKAEQGASDYDGDAT
jgi:hypothetical protein